MQFSTLTCLAALFSATPLLAAPAPTHPHASKDQYKSGQPIFNFAKTFHVTATPDQVRNGTNPAPGQPGATGLFKFGIAPEINTICYNITLYGVVGNYSSPALTATHIHEAAVGTSGPPRIVFPNPVGDDKFRISVGCVTGPFRTNVTANGQDSGTGFHVQRILDNPAGFFADTHTRAFTLGAVRGQFPSC